MKDQRKTKAQLTEELGELRQRVSELEASETEHERAEEALKESEERFRSIVETAPSLLMITDAKGSNIYVSPNCEKITGYTQEEQLGRVKWWVHEDDVARVNQLFDRVFREGVGGRDLEFKAVKKNGELWHASSSWEPLTDKEGNLTGVVVQTIDITDRNRAQEALQRLMAFNESIVQNAAEGIVVIDAEGYIAFTNPFADALLGYDAESLGGQHWTLIVPPDQQSVVVAADERRARGESDQYELELVRKDGPRIPILVSGTPRFEGGRFEGTLAVFTDITERKKAEEALREYSERLEEMVEERTNELRGAQEELMRKERLAILGQLAGGVSHELRNPLATISNAVYYLQMTLPDADQTTKEYLELIYQQVRSAAKIISDLLDFSRETTADREEVAVSQLVGDLLERHAPPDDVAATTHVPTDLPPVFIDARQIGQVLDNLVTNAYQAMPEGGTLTIKTSEVSRKPPRSREVAISITDTGVGIPEGNLEKLFEPLFSTKPRGIGLGLAVSKIFIEANGGSIEVESEEGKGSTFTLILPTKQVA